MLSAVDNKPFASIPPMGIALRGHWQAADGLQDSLVLRQA